MTESEWLASTDPAAMLEHLTHRSVHAAGGFGTTIPRDKPLASDRKRRLFVVACCRQVWHLLTDEQSRRAVEVAERYADGLVDEKERERVKEIATEYVPGRPGYEADARYAAWTCCCADKSGLVGRSRIHAHQATGGVFRHDGVYDSPIQAALLREIVGNPFRPVNISTGWSPMAGKPKWVEPICSWLTWNDGTVPRIARRIYEDRAFDLMPILADALEDAGCADEAILGHCRSGGSHVRGCWLLDILLGKE